MENIALGFEAFVLIISF